MIENKRSAIVIKSSTSRSTRITLIDKYDGKCRGYSSKRYIAHGSVIEYQIKRRSNNIRPIDGMVCMVPTYASQYEQLFFHHILELCNFFIPFGYKDDRLYEFLKSFCHQYNNIRPPMHKIKKDIVLFKACALLGIYPQDSFFHTPYYYRLSALSLDQIAQDTSISDLICMDMLRDWIYTCIMQYPCVVEFKTKHFLTAGRKV